MCNRFVRLKLKCFQAHLRNVALLQACALQCWLVFTFGHWSHMCRGASLTTCWPLLLLWPTARRIPNGEALPIAYGASRPGHLHSGEARKTLHFKSSGAPGHCFAARGSASRNTARMKVLRSRSSCVVLLLALVASSASAQTISSTAGQCGRVHAVQPGDTCSNLNNYGLSSAALQSLNPGIACDNLQPGQRLCSAPCSSTYTLVPGDSCRAVGNQFGLNTSQLQALNSGLNCNLVQPGQMLCVGECSRAYSVVAGDFCFSIASQAGLSPDQLLAMNPRLNCSALFPDQALCISTCSRKYTVAPNDSCWDIATANGLTMDQLVALNPGLNCSTITAGQFLCLPSCSSTYTVAAGDSCFSVAAAYGTTLAQLESLNPNLNCSLVYPGQLVCVAFSQTPLSLAPSSPTIGGSGSGSSSSSSSAVAVGVGIGVGVGGLLILLLAGFLVWKHRRRTQSATASTGKPAAGTGSPDTMQIDAAAADSNLQNAADDVVLEMTSVPDKAPRYSSSLGDSALSTRVAAAQTASQMLKRVSVCACDGRSCGCVLVPGQPDHSTSCCR